MIAVKIEGNIVLDRINLGGGINDISYQYNKFPQGGVLSSISSGESLILKRIRLIGFVYYGNDR